MSEQDKITINFYYGGFLEKSYGRAKYCGGFKAERVNFDPDKILWFVFEEFVQSQNIKTRIEKLWYKLSHEDMVVIRSIYHHKDELIREMCDKTRTTGALDVYIEHELLDHPLLHDYCLMSRQGEEQHELQYDMPTGHAIARYNTYQNAYGDEEDCGKEDHNGGSESEAEGAGESQNDRLVEVIDEGVESEGG